MPSEKGEEPAEGLETPPQNPRMKEQEGFLGRQVESQKLSNDDRMAPQPVRVKKMNVVNVLQLEQEGEDVCKRHSGWAVK